MSPRIWQRLPVRELGRVRLHGFTSAELRHAREPTPPRRAASSSLALFRQRFGTAGDFVFEISGPLEAARIKKLAAVGRISGRTARPAADTADTDLESAPARAGS